MGRDNRKLVALEVNILFWALSGLFIGLLANIIIRRHGILEDVIVGVVGAVIGGWLALTFVQMSMVDLNPYSIIGSLGGAFILLALSRRITRDRKVI